MYTERMAPSSGISLLTQGKTGKPGDCFVLGLLTVFTVAKSLNAFL